MRLRTLNDSDLGFNREIISDDNQLENCHDPSWKRPHIWSGPYGSPHIAHGIIALAIRLALAALQNTLVPVRSINAKPQVSETAYGSILTSTVDTAFEW